MKSFSRGLLGMLIPESMEPPQEPPLPQATLPEPRPVETGFVLNRDNVTLSDLLSRASEAWSRDLGIWVLAFLLYGFINVGIPGAMSLLWGIVSAFQQGNGEPGAMFSAVNVIVQVVLQLVQVALTAVFTLGLWCMAIRGIQGERATIGMLFSQVSKIWKYVAQAIVVGLGAVLIVLPILLIVLLAFVGPVSLDTPMPEVLEKAGPPFGLASLVLLPLYVYLISGIAFMHAELTLNDDAGPIDAILYSWRIAHGRRWRIIGTGLLVGFIWLGSMMFCGIGLLFGGPFATLAFAALYLALRNGADVPALSSRGALAASS